MHLLEMRPLSSLLPDLGFREETIMLFNEALVFLGLFLWGVIIWAFANRLL